MGIVFILMRVVGVVRGEQWRLDFLGDLEQLWIGPMLLSDAVILDLDEEVVATEDVLQACGLLERTLLVAVQQRLQHVTAEATARRDQAIGVLLEQLPVHAGLVVIALHERERRELDEVLVALVVLCQQDEVVVELLVPYMLP